MDANKSYVSPDTFNIIEMEYTAATIRGPQYTSAVGAMLIVTILNRICCTSFTLILKETLRNSAECI